MRILKETKKYHKIEASFAERLLSEGELSYLVKADRQQEPNPKPEPLNGYRSSSAWRTNPQGLMRRARNEFGEFLSRPQWEWFVTQTFKAEYVSPRESDRAWYSWLNGLRVSAKAKGYTPSIYGAAAPFYFRVTEFQDRGTLHFHALIGNVGDIRRLLFKDMWELAGYARILPYEASKGANFYVGKYLTKDAGDIRFSHNLTKHLTTA